MLAYLKDRLVSMGPTQAQNFHDILHAYEKACGKTLPYVIDPRRPGDIAECYADPAKALNEMAGRPSTASRRCAPPPGSGSP